MKYQEITDFAYKELDELSAFVYSKKVRRVTFDRWFADGLMVFGVTCRVDGKFFVVLVPLKPELLDDPKFNLEQYLFDVVKKQLVDFDDNGLPIKSSINRKKVAA